MGMVSEDHAWILPSYYNPNWWRLPSNGSVHDTWKRECSNEVMDDILESVIFIRSVKFPPMVITRNVYCLIPRSCNTPLHKKGQGKEQRVTYPYPGGMQIPVHHIYMHIILCIFYDRLHSKTPMWPSLCNPIGTTRFGAASALNSFDQTLTCAGGEDQWELGMSLTLLVPWSVTYTDAGSVNERFSC